MIMVKKIVICVGFAFIASMLSVYVAQNRMKEAELFNKANLLLYDIYDVMNVLQYFSEEALETSSTKDAEIIIKNILVKKCIMIAAIKPEISMLQGVPLEALTRVLRYVQQPGFSTDLDDSIVDLVLQYFESIRDEVLEEAVKRKEVMKNILKGGKGVSTL